MAVVTVKGGGTLYGTKTDDWCERDTDGSCGYVTSGYVGYEEFSYRPLGRKGAVKEFCSSRWQVTSWENDPFQTFAGPDPITLPCEYGYPSKPCTYSFTLVAFDRTQTSTENTCSFVSSGEPEEAFYFGFGIAEDYLVYNSSSGVFDINQGTTVMYYWAGNNSEGPYWYPNAYNTDLGFGLSNSVELDGQAVQYEWVQEVYEGSLPTPRPIQGPRRSVCYGLDTGEFGCR